jgi:hypothetical protein
MDVVFWGAAGLMALRMVPAVRLPKTAGTQGGSLSEPAREGQPVAA